MENSKTIGEETNMRCTKCGKTIMPYRGEYYCCPLCGTLRAPDGVKKQISADQCPLCNRIFTGIYANYKYCPNCVIAINRGNPITLDEIFAVIPGT